MIYLPKYGILDMDRLKEIEEASFEAFDITLPKEFDDDTLSKQVNDLRKAFVIGALWADNHSYSSFMLPVNNEITNVELEDDTERT